MSMTHKKFTVSDTFVREALEARYAQVEDQWGNEITEFFWEDFVDMIIDTESVGDLSVSEIVDNYLVNSDCGYLDDYRESADEEDEDVLERLDPLFYDREHKFVMVSA